MSQVTMPNGDVVEFPDDMPKDQIKGMIAKKFPNAEADAQAVSDQSSPWGRIRSGLMHGAESPIAEGMKAVGMEPWQSYKAYEETKKSNPSQLRDWSETIGSAIPSTLLRTEGAIPTAIGGGTIGALEPAKDWKERATNALTGAVTAELGPAAAKALKHPRIVEGLNHLLTDAAAIAGGGHFYGIGGAAGGLLSGEALNYRLHHWLPQGGLTGVALHAMRQFPGLAAHLSVQSGVPQQAPAAAEKGYEEMTTPDQ